MLFFTTIPNGLSQTIKWENDLDLHRSNVPWENEKLAVTDSLSGNHYISVNKDFPYGLGYKGAFPELLLDKSLSVKIEFSARSNSMNGKSSFVFSIQKNDSIIYWESRKINEAQKFTRQSYTFLIPGSIVIPDNVLSFFVWNESGESVLDVDSMQVTFDKLNQPSFIPEVNLKRIQFKQDKQINNDVFKILIDSINKNAMVLTNKQDSVYKNVSFYISYKKKAGDSKKHSILFDKANSLDIVNTNDEKKVLYTFKSGEATVEVSFSLNPINSLTVSARVVFLKDVYLERASLIMNLGAPVEKVFTKYSGIDSTGLEDEYWLENEGFLITGTDYNLLQYRGQELSSFQLSIEKKLLIVNADLASDHPMMYFPILKKSKSYFTDKSCRLYKVGEELKLNYRIIGVKKNQPVVRILKNPNGFPASLVWTEHADYSNIRTQRAVNFGSEFISNADSATGGFVGHNIPITKSVFYSNPTALSNSVKDGRFSEPSISILGSENFKELLFQLKGKNQEICLHTPDPFTSTRKLVDESLKFMKRNFNSVSWIDHGYDNAVSSNREDIACDGLNESSPYNISDLLELNGIRYFWNNYYEDSVAFKNASFNSFFSSPYSGWGLRYPTPEYYKVPSTRLPFYSWCTKFTLDPANGDLWSYYFSSQRLNDLVQSFSNIIIHSYPARVDSTTGYYSYNENGIVVNPDFDRVLSTLRQYNDRGEIWLTTIEKLMSYRLALEKIKIDYLIDSRCVLFNDSDKPIDDVSFITEATGISSGEKSIRIKNFHGQTIFILSFLPHEKIVIDQKMLKLEGK